MAIIKDNKRQVFYINYKWRTPTGEWKNVNIKNKDWKFSVGIRYMRSIETSEIEKDKAKKQYTYHEGDTLTLEQLVEAFFRVIKSEGIDSETIYNYSLAFKNYFYKIVAQNTKVDKVFTIKNMDDFRVLLTSKNLAEKTINNKLVAVKNLLKFAKSRKYVSRDMADDAIDLLAPAKMSSRLSERKNFFENGEVDVRKFISSFDEVDKEWRVPILTLFYGALRIGEWLGIERNCIDFDKGLILIKQQVDNHGKIKNKTKTGHDRYIRLPMDFMPELERYVTERAINNDECIFVGERGAHISRHRVRDMVNKHLSMCEIEHITLHGLRHSFATRMFDKGYNVKEVQEQLGHTDGNTTMKYYIHYTKSKESKRWDDLL